MKISRKFILSNIIVSVLTAIILSITISLIVSNYISADKESELARENKELTVYVTLKDLVVVEEGKLFLLKKELYKYDKTEPFQSTAIVLENGHPTYYLLPPNNTVFDDSTISKIVEKESHDIYELSINGDSYLSYNNKTQLMVDGQTYTVLINTILPNKLVQTIITRIITILIASIFFISVISIFISINMSRKITMPIDQLRKATEKIANKQYGERVEVNTGDELEMLANSINHMADSIKRHEVEQKKFLENVSHELKTPITVISGYAQGIKKNIFPNVDDVLDTIIVESTELKKQLENIIYLSKLDTIEDFFQFEESSVNDIIRTSISKVESIIILNEIDVHYKPSTDVILIVDRQKLERMNTNILSNCLKYTKDSIHIHTKCLSGWYQIQIIDNGEGFSQSILENPYSRNVVGEKEGSGIGLSIIKRIVDGHGGHLTLSNGHLGGAIYTIDLPINRNE